MRVRDITDRKQNEETLRLHSTILNNLAEGIYLVRVSDGIIVFANQQFERIFGYEHDELLGKNVSIVNAPDEKSPETVAAAIIEELKLNGVWQGEVQNIKKDGTVFWCHASVTTFDHFQFGLVWVVTQGDITERKSDEAQLVQSKAELEALYNNAPCGYHSLDLDGRFIRINKTELDWLGYERDEVIGRRLQELTLKELGVYLSMDDFGTGYSSLSYLQRLPVDELKIDQSFVRDLFGSSDNENIVKTIIMLANGLNMSIIAEGVETQEQFELLIRKGCSGFQGYLFSKPLPLFEFEKLFELPQLQ